MVRATRVQRGGDAALTVTLDHDSRHRRRVRLVADEGLVFLLDLPEARVLRDGDVLMLDDGQAVQVRAAREDVVEVTAADPAALVRLAWHLGNRHAPVQVLTDRLRMRPDHVLEAMLLALGCVVERRSAPFDPEVGAYAKPADHGRDHHHDE